MIRRRASIIKRITLNGAGGNLQQIVSENPRRVALDLENIGTTEVTLATQPGLVDVTLGFSLQSADPQQRISWRGKDACPQNAFFAGSSSGGGLIQAMEVTEEDAG